MQNLIDITCANCGRKQDLVLLYKANLGSEKSLVKKFSARKQPDRTHYRLVRCKRCGLIFSSQIFPKNKIEKLYLNSSYSYTNHLEHLKNTYLSLFLSGIQFLKRKPSRILDIGCSNGFFLEGLTNLGYQNTYGVEPSKREVENAPKHLKKKILTGLFNDKQFHQNFFDVICCFHTLDHVVEVNTFLSNVYKKLKKNGLAIFVVHDTDGLSVKLFGEKSPIFDIQHIYLFNKKSLTGLFQKNNFEVIKTGDLKNTYSLEYWTQMSGLPPALKKMTSRILRMFKMDNKSLTLAAGNIYIIARK